MQHAKEDCALNIELKTTFWVENFELKQKPSKTTYDSWFIIIIILTEKMTGLAVIGILLSLLLHIVDQVLV